MKRAQAILMLIMVLLTLFLSGCDLFRKKEKPEVDLTVIFPDDLPTVGQAKRLNVDGVGNKEWLVFYHIDLVGGNLAGSPISAAVYRPVPVKDKRIPPHLIPALLWLPNQGYVCLFTCEATMEEVISEGPTLEELVIRDKRGNDTVGVAIFRWDEQLEFERGSEEDPGTGGFVPLGHFRGDTVLVVRDNVTVIRKNFDRSDLAAREIYIPQSGHYYQKEVRHVDAPPSKLRPPQEAEIVFALGPPEQPSDVKLPEKLVLAFYQSFRNLDTIESYFTKDAWTKIGRRCLENMCGCTSKYEDVSRVMVKQIAYEADLKKTTRVVAQVVCVNNRDQTDPINTVTWSLRKEPDSTWRLSDMVLGGDSYLCPRAGCPPAARRQEMGDEPWMSQRYGSLSAGAKDRRLIGIRGMCRSQPWLHRW